MDPASLRQALEALVVEAEQERVAMTRGKVTGSWKIGYVSVDRLKQILKEH